MRPSSLTVQFTVHLAEALLLGAIVGMERQWRQRMAGTRTNALVAAGASAFVMAGSLLENDPSAPGRIASYVVSGVGFLGAGVIFKEGGNVRGLNTARRNHLVLGRHRSAHRLWPSAPLTHPGRQRVAG